ncbi:IucA/IucC family siderophore biosynthesis protein [Actinomadura sp. ATCC 31491]|uniref:IucA/IucC family siderophore biosynthesis protein n=1 Tax=Actinomadura luzonensis TaxID=2805427 RepID=A0ABT0FNI9_9ACTN|nr:IucA/IucC family protein [Actinomadura luzonensis]MCK2213872.1 IucA/IucC family siderophore biosynthesis protein [Actinomadura luzonensis]
MGRVESEFAARVAAVRPALSGAYAAAVPGARAAVLGRLWRSLLHEPLPGVAASPGHSVQRGQTPGLGPATVTLADGRVLRGPGRRPHDLGEVPALWLDGEPYAEPAGLLAALALPGSARLTEDLANSVASLALSRANARPRPPRTPEDHEQGVVDGHPYHPCCRNRPGVSVAEQLAYMPEHRPVVALDLVAVPAAGCLVSGPWPAALTDGDRLLLPVHPWQSEHVLPDLGLRPHVTGAVPAHPLMSVRTLAPLDGGPHLKTAFSTRMTSDVRDISPGSIRDCVLLSDLLAALSRRAGGPRMVRYLAGAAASVKGEYSADVSVMLREPTSAFAGGGAAVLPVAAVTSDTTGDPAAWLTAFARIALPPALRLLTLGAALEAHGQNLLVVLDGHGLPARLAYRDLADVRLSPARLARHGVAVPPVSARLLHDDPRVLHAKLFGSLVGTTFGSLIARFAGGDLDRERGLWRIVRETARKAFEELPCNPDVRLDREALFAPYIMGKAHLLAQLEGTRSGDNWIKLPNPLFAVM